MSGVNRYYAPGLDCMWRDPSIAPRECTPMVLASDYDLLQAERDELRAQVEAMRIAVSGYLQALDNGEGEYEVRRVRHKMRQSVASLKAKP